jgi:hypothetical protein
LGGTGGVAGAAAVDITGHATAQTSMEVGSLALTSAGVAMVILGAVTSNDYTANQCDAVLASP